MPLVPPTQELCRLQTAPDLQRLGLRYHSSGKAITCSGSRAPGSGCLSFPGLATCSMMLPRIATAPGRPRDHEGELTVQCAALPTFLEVVFHVLHPIVSTKRPSASPASGGKGRRRVVTSVRSRPGDTGGSERGCGRRGGAGAVSAFSTCEDVDPQCRSASCAVAVRLGHVTLTTALTRQPHSLNLRQLPRPKADSRHFAPGTEEPSAVSPTSEPATTTPNDTSDQMDFAGVQRTCHPDATEPRGRSPGRGTCEATEQALRRLGLKSYPALLSITVQHGSCG